MIEPQGLFIGGRWHRGSGAKFSRHDPTEGRLVWEGNSAGDKEVDLAVSTANAAAKAWARTPLDDRASYLEAFAQAAKARGADLLDAICTETGKPRWESTSEVAAIQKKVALTRQALALRRNAAAATRDGVTSATRYRPLGTLAVLGPFNLPAHLPNGQIVPALLAGNTVVFKPSESTPRVGEIYAECWQQANLPAGVFNMIQGGREQGGLLATHSSIDGVLFTGSHAGGVALSIALAPHPEKMLALEMGGNNPLIAASVANLDAAAYAIIQSAFITAGQRCTCARRLIVPGGKEGDRLLQKLLDMVGGIRVGSFKLAPEPFMGPVISEAAGQRLLASQEELVRQGAQVLTRMQPIGSRINMLSPGILDVTGVAHRQDEELFGPMLQVIRVNDFDAAVAEANNTRFGLAAGLLSDDAALYARFSAEIRAGIVNWNRPTTGAAGDLPFGGIGASGNHRPAGFFAIDFCSDPVASIEATALQLPANLTPGITR